MKKILVILAILGALAAHFHATGLKATPHNRVITAPKTHTCIASWYGEKYRGRLTASGSTYNPKDLTAAHKTLPYNAKDIVIAAIANEIIPSTDKNANSW